MFLLGNNSSNFTNHKYIVYAKQVCIVVLYTLCFTDYQYITILEDVLIHKSDFSTASGFMPSQAASPNTLQKNMFEQEVGYRYKVLWHLIHLVTQTIYSWL